MHKQVSILSCVGLQLLCAGCGAATALPRSGLKTDTSVPSATSAEQAAPCYDPQTYEYHAVCPQEIIELAVAAQQALENQANADDIDGDGVINEFDPDVDGDGIPNGSDRDIDGDGIPNNADDDIDGDGKTGRDDPDEDGDGLADRFDLNDDGDGLFDDEDESTGTSRKDEEDDEEDHGEDEDTLEDLLERQRDGSLTDEDRYQIAKEITDRLDEPAARDAVLKALLNLGVRAEGPGRAPGGPTPQIAAVDAVYEQLSQALEVARNNAGVREGRPATDAVLRAAVAEFLPRAQAMDEMSKTFKVRSVGGLGETVSDLRNALGSPERTLEFAQAARRLDPDATIYGELEDLNRMVTGARILGPVFDTTPGGELFDAIDLLNGEVDSAAELEEALQLMAGLAEGGHSFEQARDQVLTDVILGSGAGEDGID